MDAWPGSASATAPGPPAGTRRSGWIHTPRPSSRASPCCWRWWASPRSGRRERSRIRTGGPRPRPPHPPPAGRSSEPTAAARFDRPSPLQEPTEPGTPRRDSPRRHLQPNTYGATRQGRRAHAAPTMSGQTWTVVARRSAPPPRAVARAVRRPAAAHTDIRRRARGRVRARAPPPWRRHEHRELADLSRLSGSAGAGTRPHKGRARTARWQRNARHPPAPR